MMTRTATIGLTAALALGGCFDNVTTDFPEGLEPWEMPNEAPPPEGTAEDPYPEEITFVRKRWMGALSVHSRAYVHADVATTFAAVRHPLAGADRRPAVTFEWEYDVEPEYEHSHRSHLVIPDIVTVEFWLTWRSGVVEGTSEAPTVTATRWQKTDGTSAISLLEGSIVCRRVTDDVTELEIQYHLNAFGAGFETIENYLRGYFDSVLLLAHGTAPEDLPPQ
ncbi:MAG: hypothetical protein M5U28_45715 [Sandaracinaceae bacterium]|nr:hypothetical protein [Sandaracinaceae bacterium]